MKKLEFSIPINATKEKVWEALWKDENYRKWVAVFMEGSYTKSDWKEGGEIQFLGAEGNGMYAVIEQLVPYEKMYFLHRGEIKDGVKQEASGWDDAIERYDLIEKDGKTLLTATMNAPEEYIGYFANTFPKALEIVKNIAEN